MPEFDLARLTEPERIAYLARLKQIGPATLAAMFVNITWWVEKTRERGLSADQAQEQIIGEYWDMDHLVALGPTIRHRIITLAKAMVSQSILEVYHDCN